MAQTHVLECIVAFVQRVTSIITQDYFPNHTFFLTKRGAKKLSVKSNFRRSLIVSSIRSDSHIQQNYLTPV
jgi:hypothetical protein